MAQSLVAFTLLMLVAAPGWSVPVSERSEPREPELECRERPVELGIVFDSSLSIRTKDFKLGLKFVQDLVSHFNIGEEETRVSFVLYGSGLYLERSFNLTEYNTKDEVLEAIGQVTHMKGNYTGTGRGIDYLRETQLAADVVRSEATKIGVVITDGNSQASRRTKKAAAAAAADGIVLIAVGVGKKVRQRELKNIAAGHDDRVLTADNYSSLDKILEPLQEKICEPIETTEAPFTLAPPSLSISETTEAPFALAPPTAPPKDEPEVFNQGPSELIDEEVCEEVHIELGIVLDSSASIWPPDFELGKEFLQDLVESFDVGQEKTRVSLILFGDGIYTGEAFDLTTYSSGEDVVEAIGQVRHMAGNRTETFKGIDYMREHQLAEGIVRPGLRKVGVVITDGASHDQEETAAAAARAVNDGIMMIAVGVGSRVEGEELLSIAGRNASRVITTPDFPHMQDLLSPLRRKICKTTGVKSAPVSGDAGCVDPTDVFFVFSQSALGSGNTAFTSKVVGSVVESGSLNPENTYVILSDSCIQSFEAGTFETAQSCFQEQKSDGEDKLPSLVEEMALAASKSEGVAVIFSARDENGLVKVKDSVRLLDAVGVTVLHVDVSDNDVGIAGATTLSDSNPITVANKLVSELCS